MNLRFSALEHQKKAMTASLMNRVSAMKLEKVARVDLPWPPRDLSPNRSRNVHWSKKSKTVRDYKAVCIGCCQEAKLHLKKH
jgi:hypothetical protein